MYAAADDAWLKAGDEVRKCDGDYQFHGWVLSVFVKRSGAVRCAVENHEGLVHIFNQRQLLKVIDTAEGFRLERYPERKV